MSTPTDPARNLAVPLPGSYRAICDWCLTLCPSGSAASVIVWLLTHAVEQHPDSPLLGKPEGPQARAATVVSEPSEPIVTSEQALVAAARRLAKSSGLGNHEYVRALTDLVGDLLGYEPDGVAREVLRNRIVPNPTWADAQHIPIGEEPF